MANGSLLSVLAICVIPILSAPSLLASVTDGIKHHSRPPSSVPSVRIDSGVVLGKVASAPGCDTQVNQFLGIPFAQPPVGNLRFAPPRPVHGWSQPVNATTYSATCIQDFGETPKLRLFNETLFSNPPPVPNVEDEDCLYLNVYVPDSDCSQDKAVMIWIYGGGFNFGSSSLPLYDGTSFAAKRDIIVVTFNYRLNVFGYPRSPELPLAERNLGHLDQRLALDWVKRNIHAFGGDPKKVTIAGESAGAISVDDLITTMPEDPPFRGAILQSGQASYPFPPPSPNNDTTSWKHLMESIGCVNGSSSDILACARAVNGTTLKTIVNTKGLAFNQPVADNKTRLQYPYLAHATGKIARVPIFAGSNYNDGTVFAVSRGDNVTKFISSAFPPSVAQNLSKIYSSGTAAKQGLMTGNEIISKILTDSTFFCPSIFYSNITTAAAHVPSWVYLFNATFPNTQHSQYSDLNLGVYHSSEIPLVFGTYPKNNLTTGEQQLSEYMQTAWADFVKDPQSGPGSKPYPSIEILGADEQKAMVTATNVTNIDQDCSIWEEIFGLLFLKELQ